MSGYHFNPSREVWFLVAIAAVAPTAPRSTPCFDNLDQVSARGIVDGFADTGLGLRAGTRTQGGDKEAAAGSTANARQSRCPLSPEPSPD
jgi:hypothetical protein